MKIPIYYRNNIRTISMQKNTNENAMYRHSLKIVVVMIIKIFLGVLNIFKIFRNGF